MLTPLIIAACSWADPGANPYTGPVPAAVESYADIPADVRQRLRARMERRDYDDVALITRESIAGGSEYTDLRGMHFGAPAAGGRPRVCLQVDRSAWQPDQAERGLVYCEAEHCLIVPTVCRNVSRVTRLARRAEPAAAAALEPLQLGGGGAVVDAAPVSFAALAQPDAVPAQAWQRPAVVDWQPPPAWWLPPPLILSPPMPPISEPPAGLLLAAGLAALALLRRR